MQLTASRAVPATARLILVNNLWRQLRSLGVKTENISRMFLRVTASPTWRSQRGNWCEISHLQSPTFFVISVHPIDRITRLARPSVRPSVTFRPAFVVLPTYFLFKFLVSSTVYIGHCIYIFRIWPSLLSTPEKLGNWTDGRISCRHSAPTSFLVDENDSVASREMKSEKRVSWFMVLSVFGSMLRSVSVS